MTTMVIPSVDQVPIDLLARDLRLPVTMTPSSDPATFSLEGLGVPALWHAS
jgi:hypothetical protein